MNTKLRSIRSFVFTVILVLILSGFYTVTALTGTTETVKTETAVTNICPDCYIVYVWIEHVRWAQVYNADGSMIDMYEDPED